MDDSTLPLALVIPGYIRLRKPDPSELLQEEEEGEEGHEGQSGRLELYPRKGPISYLPIRHGRPPPRKLPQLARPRLSRAEKEARRERREAAAKLRAAAELDALALSMATFNMSTEPEVGGSGSGVGVGVGMGVGQGQEERPSGRGERGGRGGNRGVSADIGDFGFEPGPEMPGASFLPISIPSSPTSRSPPHSPSPSPSPSPQQTNPAAAPALAPGLSPAPHVDLTPHSPRAYLRRLRTFNSSLNPSQRLQALEAALHCIVDPSAPHHRHHHHHDKHHKHHRHHKHHKHHHGHHRHQPPSDEQRAQDLDAALRPPSAGPEDSVDSYSSASASSLSTAAQRAEDLKVATWHACVPA